MSSKALWTTGSDFFTLRRVNTPYLIQIMLSFLSFLISMSKDCRVQIQYMYFFSRTDAGLIFLLTRYVCYRFKSILFTVACIQLVGCYKNVICVLLLDLGHCDEDFFSLHVVDDLDYYLYIHVPSDWFQPNLYKML